MEIVFIRKINNRSIARKQADGYNETIKKLFERFLKEAEYGNESDHSGKAKRVGDYTETGGGFTGNFDGSSQQDHF